MNLSKELFSAYVKNFEFKDLFIDMGWNNDRVKKPVVVDSALFVLESVAEKEGFKILHCHPDAAGLIPVYSLRKKIEHQVTKLFHEHLIIYTDAAKTEQIWQLAVRESGKPLKVTETSYRINQSPEKLYQRAGGLFITIDEEEKFTIVDVKSRVAQNFQQNSEKVTKKFYDGFKKQHTVFLDFIKGIQAEGDREWYASLMLNRLMFCYFIQKKGFLDKNKNYLQDKLKACQGSQGPFYSFYRSFLLVLFHQGLGAPNHNAELVVEIGQVPYLNGGLFDEHEIEKLNKDINVDDKAFESLFKFFDEWDWHLDTRMNSSGKEINPDVIGYIFEKYINDRAEMGAYYTKEDITDYISKNCIIPFLFDETKRAYPSAFSPDSLVWLAVKESGDAYIYEAVKYGVPPPNEQGNTLKLFDDLPDNIHIGFVPELEQKIVDGTGPYLCDLRKQWNTPAPPSIALPTEIYREVIERRKRCADLRKKITTGEITAINDFITCNLNIRQFAQDLLENIDDPDFIRHFYKALCKITILDPTCGSGAFLFAALNILEPLYEACLLRMRAYVEDEDRKNAAEKTTFGHKYKFFRDTLASVQSDRHPNQAYFIYKSIILNNLYGVDIMNEAVEIAKLRLFLKLVATVDVDYRKPNLGLEPLPDVDFNIRAGNTLIGYAQKNQIASITGLFVTDEHKKSILEQCDVVARAFTRYKNIQLTTGDDYADFKNAKDELNNRLVMLTDDLDKVLFEEQYKGYNYASWIATHKPFHWFAEFYEIIEGNGGFDVIIGNPPYLESSQVKYDLQGYKTLESKAVHVYCIERSLDILNKLGSISMIVPLAIVSTQRMVSIQSLINKERVVWYSNYSWRPAKLFDTVNRALTIFIGISQGENKDVYATNYQKWISDNRKYLMGLIYYAEVADKQISFCIPKISNEFELSILKKINNHPALERMIVKRGFSIYYRTTGGLYWKVFTDFPPYFTSNGQKGSSSRETCFNVNSDITARILIACLSSDFFWYWYTVTSNLRDLNPSDIYKFSVPDLALKSIILENLCSIFLADVTKNSQPLIREQKQKGTTETQSFIIKKSKPIIEEIDKVLAIYYALNQRELDFIINYDIKYRIGKDTSYGAEDELL
jgi:hypothetical protein